MVTVIGVSYGELIMVIWEFFELLLRSLMFVMVRLGCLMSLIKPKELPALTSKEGDVEVIDSSAEEIEELPKIEDNSLAKTHGVDSTHQVVIRYGYGFNVVFRFFQKQSKVSRVLWLDYKLLNRKYGAFVVRRLRARAGENVLSLQSAAPNYALSKANPWGRIVLLDESLEFESIRDLRAIRFLEQTMDDALLLIEEEIPENLVNKKPWALQPTKDAESFDPKETEKRKRIVDVAMDDLIKEDKARKTPLILQNNPYPNLVKPPVVQKFVGELKRTGYVERKDNAGRTYRTFFADVQESGNHIIRHTGVDLQRALMQENARVGDRVEIFNIGLSPMGGGKYKKKVWSARKIAN